MQQPTIPPPYRRVQPRSPALHDCDFYHSLTLPTGEIAGQWDLRPSPETYLGHVDFKGRSVLEIGPASGFLSFHMEHAGATVSCLEPSMSHLWIRFHSMASMWTQCASNLLNTLNGSGIHSGFATRCTARKQNCSKPIRATYLAKLATTTSGSWLVFYSTPVHPSRCLKACRGV